MTRCSRSRILGLCFVGLMLLTAVDFSRAQSRQLSESETQRNIFDDLLPALDPQTLGLPRHRWHHLNGNVNTGTASTTTSTSTSSVGGGGPLSPQSGNTTTWNGNGSDDNWGTSGNWVGGITPSGGGDDIINFAGGTRLTPNNNYGPYTQYQSIFFNSGASAFTLGGNAIKYYGKIQNDSSSTQTISFADIGIVGSPGEINPVSGDMVINSTIFMDNGADLDIYGDNGKTITFNGVIRNGDSTGKVLLQQNSTVIFNAANTYSGETDINAGTIRVAVAPTGTGTSSTYFVGNGGTTGTAASLLLGSGTNGTGGGVNFTNSVIINPGNGSNRTIGGTNTSGVNTFSTNISMAGSPGQDRSVRLTAASGGEVQFSGVISGAGQNITKIGAGLVTLNGTSANTFTGTTTVSEGTLQLSKAGALASTFSVTVQNGGTLLLNNSGTTDRINNSATMTLAGGKLNLNGLSEGAAGTTGVGALTLTATSTIDFGAGNGSVIEFGGIGPHAVGSSTLSILNWTNTPVTGGAGGDRLLFDGLATSFTSQFSQTDVTFNGTTGYTANQIATGLNPYYEIVGLTPIPEPSTWVAAGMAAAALGYVSLRRKSWNLKR